MALNRKTPMTQPSSRVERFFRRLRNNRFTATLIIIGLMVSSLASFTDALTKISSLLPDFRKAKIEGHWQSVILQDAPTGVEYLYAFSFKTDGAQVQGSAARLAPSCHKSKSGVCTGFGKRTAIVDGRLERDTLSFLVDWGDVPGSVPWTYFRLTQSFRGKVSGGVIHFSVQDEQTSPPREFTAARRGAGASEPDFIAPAAKF